MAFGCPAWGTPAVLGEDGMGDCTNEPKTVLLRDLSKRTQGPCASAPAQGTTCRLTGQPGGSSSVSPSAWARRCMPGMTA